MTGPIKKIAASAALGVLAMGYLAGCGTKGDNTGFAPNFPGPIVTGGGGGSSSGTGTTGSTGITGGTNGTAVVSPTTPSTNATGLTITNILPQNAGGGSNSPTRLGLGDFPNGIGIRPVVAQGNGSGPGQGRIVILQRTPGVDAAIPLVRTAGTPDPLAITDPFGLKVEGNRIYFTNNFRAAFQGSLVRVSNIQANGNATFDVLGAVAGSPLQSMGSPIDIQRDGDFLYVAEYRARDGGGQIRRINENTGAVDVLVTNVNFPSSLALDASNGRRLLYIAENGNNSGSGNAGGVARIDLTTFTPGQPLTTGGSGSTASAGVTFIQPSAGEAAYANPFDLAVDTFGNLVITEGLTYFDPTTFIAPISQGRLRVVPATPGGGTLGTTSNILLEGLTGCRGPSIFNEDATGEVNSLFFVDGPTGLNSNLRQVTYRNADRAIFRHLLLDSGKLNALSTLFDTSPANVKYTVSFPGGTQGQVLDVR